MFVVRLDKGGDFGVEGQRLVGALAFDKDAKARMSCRPSNEHEHEHEHGDISLQFDIDSHGAISESLIQHERSSVKVRKQILVRHSIIGLYICAIV